MASSVHLCSCLQRQRHSFLTRPAERLKRPVRRMHAGEMPLIEPLLIAPAIIWPACAMAVEHSASDGRVHAYQIGIDF